MGQEYTSESYYVADKIRQIRERAGISQEELADRLRISPMTVHRIESGKRQLPVDTLLRFSDTMDVPVADLLPCKESKAKRLESEDIQKRFAQLNSANQKVVQETLSTLVNSLLLTQ